MRNNIPNLGRHSKTVRDTDFIRLTERNHYITKLNELLALFSDSDTTEINRKLEEITYNFLDAVTINPDGTIELKQIEDPDTGEMVPDIGSNSIESFPEKFEEIYFNYQNIIGDDQEWKFRVDEYFNIIFGEFITLIQSLFSNNIYLIFTFLKYDEEKDYNVLDPVNVKQTSGTTEYLRFDPDLLSYPSAGSINFEFTDVEYIIYSFQPIYTVKEDGSFNKNFTVTFTLKDRNTFYPLTIVCDSNNLNYIMEEFIFLSGDTYTIRCYEIIDKDGIPKIFFTISSNSSEAKVLEVEYELLLGEKPEVSTVSNNAAENPYWKNNEAVLMDEYTVEYTQGTGVYPNNINVKTDEPFVKDITNILDLQNVRYKPMTVKHLSLDSKEVGEYWPQKYINFKDSKNVFDYDIYYRFKKVGNKLAVKKIGNKSKFAVQSRFSSMGIYPETMYGETGKVSLGSLDALPLDRNVTTFLNTIYENLTPEYTPGTVLKVREIREYNTYTIIELYNDFTLNEQQINIIYDKVSGETFRLPATRDGSYVEELDDGNLYYTDREAGDLLALKRMISLTESVTITGTLDFTSIITQNRKALIGNTIKINDNIFSTVYNYRKNVKLLHDQYSYSRVMVNNNINFFAIGTSSIASYENYNIYKTSKDYIIIATEHYRYDIKNTTAQGIKIIYNAEDTTPTVTQTNLTFGSWKYFTEDIDRGLLFFGSAGSEGVRKSSYLGDTITDIEMTCIKYGRFKFANTTKGIFAFNEISVEYTGDDNGRINYQRDFIVNNDVENGLGIFIYDNDLQDFKNINQNGTFSNIVETSLGIFAFNELLPILYKYDEEQKMFFKYYEFAYGNVISNIQQTISFGAILTLRNVSGYDFETFEEFNDLNPIDKYVDNVYNYPNVITGKLNHKIISMNDLQNYFVNGKVKEYIDLNPNNIVHTTHPKYTEETLFRNELVSPLNITQMSEFDNGDIIFNNEFIHSTLSNWLRSFYYDSRMKRFITNKTVEIKPSVDGGEVDYNIHTPNIVYNKSQNDNEYISFSLTTVGNNTLSNVSNTDMKNVLNDVNKLGYFGKYVSTSFGDFALQNTEYFRDLGPNYTVNLGINIIKMYDKNIDIISDPDGRRLRPTSMIEFDETLYVGDDSLGIYSVNPKTNLIEPILDPLSVNGYSLYMSDTLGPIVFSKFDNTHYSYFDSEKVITTVENTDSDNMYNLGTYRNWAFEELPDSSATVNFHKLTINDFVFDYGVHGVYAFIIKDGVLPTGLESIDDIACFSLVKLTKNSDNKIVSEKCELVLNSESISNTFYLGLNLSDTVIPDEILPYFNNTVISFGFHLFDYGLVFNINGSTYRLNETTGKWDDIGTLNGLTAYEHTNTSKTRRVNYASPVFVSSDKNIIDYFDEPDSYITKEDFLFDNLYQLEKYTSGMKTGYYNEIKNIQQLIPDSNILAVIPSKYKFNTMYDSENKSKYDDHITDDFYLSILLKGSLDIGIRLLTCNTEITPDNPTGNIGNYQRLDNESVYHYIYSFEHKIGLDGYIYFSIHAIDYEKDTGNVFIDTPIIKYYKVLISDLYGSGETVIDERVNCTSIPIEEYESVNILTEESWYETVKIFDDTTGYRPICKFDGVLKDGAENVLCYNISTDSLQYMSKIDWKISKELYCYDNQDNLAICEPEGEIYGLGSNYSSNGNFVQTDRAFQNGIVRYNGTKFEKCIGTDEYSGLYDDYQVSLLYGNNYPEKMIQTREYGVIANMFHLITETNRRTDYTYSLLYRDKYKKDTFYKFPSLSGNNKVSKMSIETNGGLLNLGNTMNMIRNGNIVNFNEVEFISSTSTDIVFSDLTKWNTLVETSVGISGNYGYYTSGNLSGLLKYNRYLGEFEKYIHFSTSDFLNSFRETRDGIFNRMGYTSNSMKYVKLDGYYFNRNIISSFGGQRNYCKNYIYDTSVGTLYNNASDNGNQYIAKYNPETGGPIHYVVTIGGSYRNRMVENKHLGLFALHGTTANYIWSWNGTTFVTKTMIPIDINGVNTTYDGPDLEILSTSKNDLFLHSTRYKKAFKYDPSIKTFKEIETDIVADKLNETTDLKQFECYTFNEILSELENLLVPKNIYVKTQGHIIYNGTVIKIASIIINENPEGLDGITFISDTDTRIPLGGETYMNLIDFQDSDFTLGSIGRNSKENYNNRPDFKTYISKVELSLVYDFMKMNPIVINEYELIEGVLYFKDEIATGFHLYRNVLYSEGYVAEGLAAPIDTRGGWIAVAGETLYYNGTDCEVLSEFEGIYTIYGNHLYIGGRKVKRTSGEGNLFIREPETGQYMYIKNRKLCYGNDSVYRDYEFQSMGYQDGNSGTPAYISDEEAYTTLNKKYYNIDEAFRMDWIGYGTTSNYTPTSDFLCAANSDWIGRIDVNKETIVYNRYNIRVNNHFNISVFNPNIYVSNRLFWYFSGAFLENIILPFAETISVEVYYFQDDLLYYNGKLALGYHEYKNKLYLDGVLTTGYYVFENKLYFNGIIPLDYAAPLNVNGGDQAIYGETLYFNGIDCSTLSGYDNEYTVYGNRLYLSGKIVDSDNEKQIGYIRHPETQEFLYFKNDGLFYGDDILYVSNFLPGNQYFQMGSQEVNNDGNIYFRGVTPYERKEYNILKVFSGISRLPFGSYKYYISPGNNIELLDDLTKVNPLIYNMVLLNRYQSKINNTVDISVYNFFNWVNGDYGNNAIYIQTARWTFDKEYFDPNDSLYYLYGNKLYYNGKIAEGTHIFDGKTYIDGVLQ